MTQYDYTITVCASDRLTKEIQQSSIVVALDHITTFGAAVSIFFKDTLQSADIATLDGIIAAHSGLPLSENVPIATTITDGNGLTLNQFDNDNALIVRLKAAKKGWSYVAIPIEFTTSQISGTYISELSDGSTRGGFTVKSYDINNTEVTTAGSLDVNLTTIVKTVLDFEPTYDYEIIGGEMRTITDIPVDMRMWIIAVPDIPANYGGSKEMCGGLNLKYLTPGNVFTVDGRVSKYLTYSAINHTNKLRIILKYPAGTTESLSITFEMYRL